jgi:HD-like signal output (HDOD) protein
MTTDLAPTRSDSIDQELDQVRRSGPLQSIVIPPCPELLARLRTAMSITEPDLNEVARIATSDVAMSATLLKSANSPLFASAQPVQTIGSAMDRLGLDETAAVMSRMLVARAIKVSSPHLLRFWERAAKRSVSMRFLATKLPGISPDLAQTFGLFCHVGKPVMMQSIKGYSGTLVEANARIDRPFVATENANHRTDHAVVGALVSKLWRLSPMVTQAIRLHHDFDVLRASEAADPEACALIATGLLADHFMRRHEGLPPDADWAQHGSEALAWLQLQEDDIAHWEDELRELLDVV